MIKVLAGIVLYNPDIWRLKNEVDSIFDQVSQICMYDNGSKNIDEIKKMFADSPYSSKVFFLLSPQNIGIGAATNKIFEYAMQNEFEWVLTLDHDTICPRNLVSEYLKYINLENVGLLCPKVIDSKIVNNYWDNNNHNIIEKIEVCIQSGALINVEAWLTIGKFDEWMFVDFVDFDFGKRMIINDFVMCRCNNVAIEHELGKKYRPCYAGIAEFIYKLTKIKYVKYFTYKNDFSAARIFYCTRNNLVYIRKYKDYIDIRKEYISFLKRTIMRFLRGRNRFMIIKETYKGIKAAKFYTIEKYTKSQSNL